MRPRLRFLSSIAGLLLVGTSMAAAAPQIPAGELPGRERDRFIDRPGEGLMLRRLPDASLPGAGTHKGRPYKKRVRRHR
jgi:hypothetical protein